MADKRFPKFVPHDQQRRSTRNKHLNTCYQNRSKVKHYRPGAPYISNGGQEYIIDRDKTNPNLWYIRAYNSPMTVPKLRGRYSSFRDAENALVSWMKDKDRGYARYPGKDSNYAPFNGDEDI